MGAVAGPFGVFFPWVANDDESTGLGPADTSITIQNLALWEVKVYAYVGVGGGDLPGDNGWELVGPFFLEPLASKTFSAAQLGIAEGEGAPVAVNAWFSMIDFFGFFTCDLNDDGDCDDFETIADDDFESGANTWENEDIDGPSTWEDGDCILSDDDDGDGSPENVATPDTPPTDGVQWWDFVNGERATGANLDGDPVNCLADERAMVDEIELPSAIAGVAKQVVDGESLPYTSDVDTVVSGYNGLAGFELLEVGNTGVFEGEIGQPGEMGQAGSNNLQSFFFDYPDGWYLPIVQTNGGPGGAWNSIVRVANFGDGGGTIGAAGVNVTFYPADNASGELNQSFVRDFLVNAGETVAIDLSTLVPEGWIGSAHISADAPIFAMVDRVKVGYNMWLTNTASNAFVSSRWNAEYGFGDTFVQFLPDVRKDFFGWNTGINVANISDVDTDVTIQYYGSNGVAAQTREIHAKGMTYFYDPSQAPQDNNQQDPVTDPNSNASEIGAAIILSDEPVVSVVDATKYPESTNSTDANVYQALSYSGTENLFPVQFVPLAQKGNPNTGMGATSGIQIFNPLDNSTPAYVFWFNSSGDVVGNTTPVVINPNSMTFVYTMNDAQLPSGYLGSASVFTPEGVLIAISTQVDYAVQYDGSAAWNGYSILGGYRDGGEFYFGPIN